MSEDRAEYKVAIRSEVDEMLDDTNTAAAEVTRLPVALSGTSCSVSALGLRLSPEIKYSQFNALIRRMDNLAYGHSVRDCLFKFYIGDAFNQGEEIFGEKYAQVMEKLHWSQRYISNIQWVCRKVPEENRDIKITSWKFWSIIAPLPPKDQAFWVSEAREAIKCGVDWCMEIKKRIGSWQLAREIDAVEDEKLREEMREVAEINENVSWANVRNWRDQGKVPKKNKSSAEWWSDELAAIEIEDGLRADIFDMAMRFVEDVKNRRINSGHGRKVWAA